MKVFQIGFNKTATMSLTKFFRDSGYKSVHGGKVFENFLMSNLRKGKKLCESKDYITFWSDLNFLQRHFEVFAEQYPKAKFIYNYRPIDIWVTSRLNHYNKKQLDDIFIKKFKLNEYGVDLKSYWKSEWVLHDYKVKEYFVGKNADRVLFFDITKDGEKELKRFLPELKFNKPYQHIHKTRKK